MTMMTELQPPTIVALFLCLAEAESSLSHTPTLSGYFSSFRPLFCNHLRLRLPLPVRKSKLQPAFINHLPQFLDFPLRTPKHYLVITFQSCPQRLEVEPKRDLQNRPHRYLRAGK